MRDYARVTVELALFGKSCEVTTLLAVDDEDTFPKLKGSDTHSGESFLRMITSSSLRRRTVVTFRLRLCFLNHLSARQITGIHHNDSRTEWVLRCVACCLSSDFEDTATLPTASPTKCKSKNDYYPASNCSVRRNGRLVAIGCALDVVLERFELLF